MLNRPGTNEYGEETAPDNVECAAAIGKAWVFNPSFPLWGGGTCKRRKRHYLEAKDSTNFPRIRGGKARYSSCLFSDR